MATTETENKPETESTIQSPSDVTDEIEAKKEKSNDNTQSTDKTDENTDEIEVQQNDKADNTDNKEDIKIQENEEIKKEEIKEEEIDFDAIDKILFAEEIGVNTNTLSWDDIKLNDEERDGAMDLQKELRTKHKLENLPPFECARFYIGSKCRVEKASKKWLDTMDIYKTHKLQSITEQQMIKCFRQMRSFMRFGGTSNNGQAILACKYSEWLPANYESIDVVMKCFLFILNYFTENLDCSRNGMIFIADCSNIGWVNFDINMEKIFTKLMQDAYPLRVGAMYMLDAPFLLNILLKICKPFLSKKMQERIYIMSTEDMFKTVPKEQVPPIVNGGCYDDNTINPVYKNCIRYMRRSDINHFQSNENEMKESDLK